MRAGRAAAVAFAAAIGTGCPSVGSFECFGPGDCDRSDQGMCIEGACAYPDMSCASGLAWSPNAPQDPGACVDATTDTTSTTSTSSSSTSVTTVDPSTTTEIGDASTSSGPATCGFRKSIEIDSGVLSPSLALDGYPLLLALTDDDLVDEDPDSFNFADDDGTPLPHELESFDAATGALVAWVRIATWTVGEPIPLLLAWGDPGSVPDLDPGLVWSPSYVGVWHLRDALDETEGEVMRNAVAGGEHGFAYGDLGGDQSVPGAIGSGVLFDGDDDYIEVSAAFVGALQEFTVSYWARWDGTTEAGGFFARLNGEHLYPRCWKVETSGGPFCQLHSMDTTVGVGGDSDEVAPGVLTHMAFSWDGEVGTTYFDGEIGRTNSMYPGAMPLGGTNPMMIGREFEFGTFIGMLDEFRVADRALPAEWIEADYRAQSNPANTILDVGAAEPRPCP